MEQDPLSKDIVQAHDEQVLVDPEIIEINIICRLCANPNERIIGIYSEEGISNDLANKMNLYLPVKVSENDALPLQCCWSCASTVLAWHELVVASVEADRRLRKLQLTPDNDKQTIDSDYEGIDDASPTSPAQDDDRSEPKSPAASLSVFCQEESTEAELASVQSKRFCTPKKKKHPSILYQQLTETKKEEWVPCEVITAETLQKYIENIQDPFIDATKVTEEQINTSIQKTKPKFFKVDHQTGNVKNEPAMKYDEPEEILLPTKIEQNLYDDDDEEDEDEDDDKMTENNDLDSYNFSCQYCPVMFINEDDIITHVKEQHPDKDHGLNEIVPNNNHKRSNKKDRRKNTKLDHDAVNDAKVVVEGRIYYNCKICGKSLHSPYTYIWHMRIHTGERPYVCDLCGKQFRVSQGLVRHLRETHEGIKNFGCDLCGRMFATRRNVEEHRRIHTNERPYICDLCGKSFKQKASLFVHNRSHTDSFPFRCSYCNQGFRTRPPLLIHVTRHTGEKPYPCDVCGRCFRIKYELKRHKLIHSEEKPFSCADCGLSFRQKRYLRNHNKINHNRLTP